MEILQTCYFLRKWPLIGFSDWQPWKQHSFKLRMLVYIKTRFEATYYVLLCLQHVDELTNTKSYSLFTHIW